MGRRTEVSGVAIGDTRVNLHVTVYETAMVEGKEQEVAIGEKFVEADTKASIAELQAVVVDAGKQVEERADLAKTTREALNAALQAGP